MEKKTDMWSGGIWRFEIDKEDRGFAEHWEKTKTDTDDHAAWMSAGAGYGDAISEDTPWVQSLYDALWYQRGEYAYAQENGTKVPFLSQPPRHYIGKAWYQKTIFCAWKIRWVCWPADSWEHKMEDNALDWWRMQRQHSKSLCAACIWDRGIVSRRAYSYALHWQWLAAAVSTRWSWRVRCARRNMERRCRSDYLRAIQSCFGLNVFGWSAQLPKATIKVISEKWDKPILQNCISSRNRDIACTDISAKMICVLTPGSHICELTLNYPSDTLLWDEFDHGLQNLIVTLSSISNALQGEMQSSITQFTITEQRNGIAVSPKQYYRPKKLPLGFRRGRG